MAEQVQICTRYMYTCKFARIMQLRAHAQISRFLLCVVGGWGGRIITRFGPISVRVPHKNSTSEVHDFTASEDVYRHEKKCQCLLNLYMFHSISCLREKGRDLTTTKAPTPAETLIRPPNVRLHSDCARIRTVSWTNCSYQTGVVIRFMALTFLLPAAAVKSNGHIVKSL